MKSRTHWGLQAFILCALPSCAGTVGADGGQDSSPVEPAGSERAASCRGSEPIELNDCEQLAAELRYPSTVFTSSTSVPEGALTLAGHAIPAHCLLTGKM